MVIYCNGTGSQFNQGGKNDWGDYAQLEGAGQPAAEVVTSPGTVEEMDYLQNLSLT